MNRKWIALCINGCLGALCLAVFFILSLRSGSGEADSIDQAQRILFLSISDNADELERPPVKFDHAKHTEALDPRSCQHCHPRDDTGTFQFTFLDVRKTTDKDELTDLFHDSCIGCHKERNAEGKLAGPVTCGECHAIPRKFHEKSYDPVMPEYYDVLRDTYHKDCTACHREPAKKAEEAGPLDWQKFYVASKSEMDKLWPKMTFDYYLHDKHNKVLEGDCQLCHYISPERHKAIQAEGRIPTARDWVMDIDEKHALTNREAAHARCINCHLNRKEEKLEAGPVVCIGCHSGVERTIEEMADVPRPACEMDERMLIHVGDEARVEAVPFNHKSHEGYTRSCGDCHHNKTLQACDECHGIKGTEQGGWVTLAEAYHDVRSTYSCVGCHENEKKNPNCAGCHDRMQGGLVKSACTGCHTGSLDSLDKVAGLPDPKELMPDDVEPVIQVGELEDAYKPCKFPHLEIARKLTELSNNSKLAKHFHADQMTICAGCHHISPLKPKAHVPRCSTCHTACGEHDRRTPTLLGAYHQRCLGCHEEMGWCEKELPQSCTGCHEEKACSAKDQAAKKQG